MKTGSLVAIIIFAAVALAHVYRLAVGAHVTVDGTEIPQWVSIVGAVVPAGVAWLLWRENRG